MFAYYWDGLPISRAAIVAAFGGRYVSDVIEVIAGGNGFYQNGKFRITFTREVK